MTDKLIVKTRHPDRTGEIIDGEVQDIVEKNEPTISYKLSDGTVIQVLFNIQNINLPINPTDGKYFEDENGNVKYNVDYRLNVTIAKRKKD